ncbi:uncharacterized protein LOC107780573 [Nicotiana tabacum]|uniref:uncharacterized protein LOC107780573 n=1 Tax=Nicotiana tabacum TaxID=4097 RepID=UPI003F4EF6AC
MKTEYSLLREEGGQTINNIDGIARAFVEFYTKLLGTKKDSRKHVCSNIIRAGPIVNKEQRIMFEADFTSVEVKQAPWGIDGEKAQGPDRYGNSFFKDYWNTVGKNLTAGVLEFFVTGKMLKALNNKVTTVIPKTKYADKVGDYRPIACCNTVYKGKKGLRQGDRVSPLLFLICMEYLTRIFKLVTQQEGFEFHTKCCVIKLNHLCFANVVLLFCKGDYHSMILILRGLKTFSQASGLTTNAGKSNNFSEHKYATRGRVM